MKISACLQIRFLWSPSYISYLGLKVVNAVAQNLPTVVMVFKIKKAQFKSLQIFDIFPTNLYITYNVDTNGFCSVSKSVIAKPFIC